MDTTSVHAPYRRTIRKHLEYALDESTDPEVRFHIRQALQTVVSVTHD
jgi:hypothetical protein